ncbi:GntR family transcriptional regulator [Miniphocaeibacter halophilus]|uniref:GntR family transcriptional regulator n=1 Tax=Miniphocaeibacter halophilus TaxID=2931922 RepID=A0AC61MT19_9FIRM|nr:GntR family transcriptional regulator [Miniphocaeibacter halophilus]QQK08742.1 GntR family transcriptional regulator [Miniphocaeibacter halophilus]
MKKKLNLREQVYKSLKLDIISGKYSLEDTINEKALMNQYNISKAPVRDALIELCNDGILKSIPRLGYKIINYSNEYLEGILKFRLIIEPKYLNEYWNRLSDENIKELENLHREQMDSSDRNDPVIYWKTNQDFHLKLASFYHDEFFYETLENALNKQMLVFSQFYWTSWDKQVFNRYTHQHDELIEFLKNGNKEKAIKDLQKDIASFMKK